ncbi:hypothetical protein RvVAR0630_11960 [Agrobacterium vitis]|uniref:hypothetical protein n=1 Tax=Agrobacterium vitis TaxID=373 RepID=UPI0015D6A032|nr:hypothetical protein [Agrobacterium vitis]BCH58572.1 hypothetical protein RvVAR0630_11960 [Agrobacterium vitis]
MKLEWTFTAESFLDQLSPADKSKVIHAVNRLQSESAPVSAGKNVRKLDGERYLYSLKVGSDFQIIFSLNKDVISIIDVVRKGQVDGIRRRIEMVRQAASG